MRVFSAITAAFLLSGALGAPAFAQAQRTARAVQLITMSADPAVAANPPEGEGGASRDRDELSQPRPDFAVHDLGRQWVSFQMQNAMSTASAPPALPEIDPEDPFAPIGVAGVTAAGQGVSPASSIDIPAWMRGGPTYAAAAAQYVPGCSAGTYRPSGFLKADAELRRQTYFAMMSDIACQYGIPVGLFDAMIIRESRYNAAIASKKDAFGLTQLMPATAAGLRVNRYDIEENLRGGAAYLRQQLDRFGQYHLALAAYNAGPGRVRGGMVPRITETQDYVDDILINWSKLAGIGRTASVQSAAAPTSAQAFGRRASVAAF